MDWSNPLVVSAYVISFIGYTLFALASAMKNKKQILLMQSTANVLCALSEGLIGAWSGFVQDLVNLIRNVFILKKWMNFVLSIVFIILGTALGLLAFYWSFDTSGWWGLLPVFATLEFSIVILIPRVSIPVVKTSMCVSSICWAVYGIVIKLYTTTIFNAISFVLAVVSIVVYFVRTKKVKKQEEQEN